jgi:hypothetical protein
MTGTRRRRVKPPNTVVARNAGIELSVTGSANGKVNAAAAITRTPGRRRVSRTRRNASIATMHTGMTTRSSTNGLRTRSTTVQVPYNPARIPVISRT